jgi:hypothetical protein
MYPCAGMVGCRAVNADQPRRGSDQAAGIRSNRPVNGELPRVSGQVIRGSSHGDCQPSRQAAREGAAAAVTMSPPRRPGRTARL